MIGRTPWPRAADAEGSRVHWRQVNLQRDVSVPASRPFVLLRTGQPLLVFAILKIDNNGRENAYEEEVLRQMNEQEEILRPPDVKSLAYLLYRVSEECHSVVPSFHKMGIMHRGAMFRFVSICRWRITRSELGGS